MNARRVQQRAQHLRAIRNDGINYELMMAVLPAGP